MKWVNRLAGLVFGLISVGAIKDFLSKYEIVIIDKKETEKSNLAEDSILNFKPENYDHAIDLRGTPTHECVCGCNIWNLKVSFNNNEIAQYFLDMECANCGSYATAPTPSDQKDTE